MAENLSNQNEFEDNIDELIELFKELINHPFYPKEEEKAEDFHLRKENEQENEKSQPLNG